jgi:leucine dehydrogenase
VDRVRCRIVAGSANNVLASPEDGERLHERGVIVAPDYVVNSGGLVAEAARLEGEDFATARARVGIVYDNVVRVLEAARRDGVSPGVAADRLAEEILSQAA